MIKRYAVFINFVVVVVVVVVFFAVSRIFMFFGANLRLLSPRYVPS